MELGALPWQEAFRTALILGSNISIAFIIQITVFERRRSPVLLLTVLLVRGMLVNLLGGIVFQDYILGNPLFKSIYELLITIQPLILWGLVFYTFQGEWLKLVTVSMGAEIYTVFLNCVVLMLVNYGEGRETLLLSAGAFQWTDLWIPILMYGAFLPAYFIFREKLLAIREKKLKHRKGCLIFSSLYFLTGLVSWWNGYANRMKHMSWFVWMIFFVLAAGAGAACITQWKLYMKTMEAEYRTLKRQQEFLGLHKKAMEDQIRRMEESQKLIDQQMKEIEKFGDSILAGGRAEAYLKSLKEEYHWLKAGVYCSEWEIDAVLYYYAKKAEENEISWDFFFGNYQKGAVEPEVGGRILTLLLEEAIDKNLSQEKEKPRFSLTAGTVRNQVLFVLVTSCEKNFRIWRLRFYAEKIQGIVKKEKNGQETCVTVMIPCAEYYNQRTVSD